MGDAAAAAVPAAEQSFKNIVLKPDKYSGSKKCPAKPAFLGSLKRYLDAADVPAEKMASIAATFLSADIQALLFGTDDDRLAQMSWEEFRAAFLDATVGGALSTDQQVYSQLQANFYGRRGVRVHATLLAEQETLFQQLKVPAPDATKILFIVKITHPELVNQVQQTSEGRDWADYITFRANFLAKAAVFEATQRAMDQLNRQRFPSYGGGNGKPRHNGKQQRPFVGAARKAPYTPKRHQRPFPQQQQQYPRYGPQCHRCGKFGHYAPECRAPAPVPKN